MLFNGLEQEVLLNGLLDFQTYLLLISSSWKLLKLIIENKIWIQIVFYLMKSIEEHWEIEH